MHQVPRLDEVSPAYQFVMTLQLLLGAGQRDIVGPMQDHRHILTQVTVSWDSK
jgi:hypothetical protein